MMMRCTDADDANDVCDEAGQATTDKFGSGKDRDGSQPKVAPLLLRTSGDALKPWSVLSEEGILVGALQCFSLDC